MRIERTGEITPLTPRVIEFLTSALGGLSMDEIHSAQARRIDYSCLRGLLAVELKTLEESGTERLDNLTDELRERDDWPIFLGSAPMQSFINNTNDPDGIHRRVAERIGRAIIKHLKKANHQLEAHSLDFPRRSMVRLVLFVNEDHEIYDPHTVAYILWHAVRRTDGNRRLYEHIDGILYLTQRHATIRNSKLTFPVVIVEGRGCYTSPWKSRVLDFVANRWSQMNGYAPEQFGSVDEFVTIDHIPGVAPRHERWRTDYKRNSDLRALTMEQLRDRFDENTVLSLLCFLKNPPIELSKDQGMAVIRRFGDFTQEMGERAIPITEFPYALDRHIAAAERLGLPSQVVSWLTSLDGERTQ